MEQAINAYYTITASSELQEVERLSIPNAPIALDEMDTATFDSMMSEGLAQAKAGQGIPLETAFSLLRRGV